MTSLISSEGVYTTGSHKTFTVDVPKAGAYILFFSASEDVAVPESSLPIPKINNVAMPKISTCMGTGANTIVAYGLYNPPVGTVTITANYSSNYAHLYVAFFDNCKASEMTGYYAGTPSAISVNEGDGDVDLFVDCVVARWSGGHGTITPYSGQTKLRQDSIDVSISAISTAPSTQSYMVWTFSQPLQTGAHIALRMTNNNYHPILGRGYIIQ